MMDKKALRQEIRLRKRQFNGEQLRQLSLAVVQRLLVHPRVVQANTVMFYHSLPDEVYTHEAVDQLVKMGKRVLLPVVIDEQHLEIRQYQGPQDLKLGAMNILEPAGKPFTAYQEIETILVPGMSFDPHGNRLGRGKGYYDRFLSECRGDTLKIGLSYFPPENNFYALRNATDVFLDYTITPSANYTLTKREY